MLRLETLDVALSDPCMSTADVRSLDRSRPVAMPPVLVTRALGEMIAGRSSEGMAGFAIEQFCAALIDEAPHRALEVVQRLLDCGVSVDAFYETYIPRAATRLGDMWLDDQIGFTGVTLGMARLTEVFRSLSPRYLCRRPDETPHVRGAATRAGPFRALLALAPGEDHALGVVMAADQFQRAGWAVRVELRSTPAGLECILRERAFDLVGLSAGSRRRIPVLRDTVARLRAATRPATRFALGGALVALDENAAEACGVDIAASAVADILAEYGRQDHGG